MILVKWFSFIFQKTAANKAYTEKNNYTTIDSEKDLYMKMDFFHPFCFLYRDRSAVKTCESWSNHLFLWTRVLFEKKWFCGFLFAINIMTKECFCAYTPDTVRFILRRSLSDTASKCFLHQYSPKLGSRKIFRFLNDVRHYFNQPHW